MELLDELELKRERENGEAERHRRRRDELNDKTREWVMRRDDLNAQVRALVEEAMGHRQKRDELNSQVKKSKEERDVWNRTVNEFSDRLNELKRRKLPNGTIPLSRLKRELRDLEFKQMTSVLTQNKEAELIKEMTRVQAEVRRIEQALEQDAEVKKALEELRDAKDRAESAHRMVGQLAEQAQREHDAMTELYERSDELRKQADLAQEEFIKTKMLSDEEHRKHIENILQVHDFDRSEHVRQHRAP
ncbi:MAG: phosphoserine phosphatase, partial [Candidatus Thermoplasmatota archaeon]